MKWLRHILLSFVVLLVMMCTIVPTSIVKADGLMTLSQLQAKFPNGKYWNHAGNPGSGNSVNNQNGWTTTPCSKHGTVGTSDQTCNGFQPGNTQLSWQCMGYAEKLGYDFTGSNPRNNANGWYTYTSSSALDSLKAGDIVRYKNNGHSIFVTAVNGNTVTYTDCNSDGHCVIRWGATISKATLKSTFTNVRSAPYSIGNGNDPSTASIDSVSIASVSSNHISVNFACSSATKLARVVVTSVSTGQSMTTDYTSNLGNVTHTFNASSMTNPGRTFTIYIYGYTSTSGGGETLHRVTYLADAGYVTLPEVPVKFNIDYEPEKIVSSSPLGGWAIAPRENPVVNVICYVNGVAYECPRTTRSDVASAFPDYQTTNQGFSLQISPMYIVHGSNTIRLVATQQDGSQTDIYNKTISGIKMDPELFDPVWYYANYFQKDNNVKEIGINIIKLMEHYYNQGIQKGYKPNICFNPNWYYKKNTDLSDDCTNVDIYEHYVYFCLGNNETRETSCFLNLSTYLSRNKDLQELEYNTYQLTKHYLLYGSRSEGRLGSNNAQSKAFAKVYNAKNYAALNKDLAKELGDGVTEDSVDKLWNHFWERVIAGEEGRKTNTSFDFGFYKTKYGYATNYEAFWTYLNSGYSNNHATIEVKVTDISLSSGSIILEEGETDVLTYTLIPSNATNKSVKWSSENKEVAQVDSKGNITAISAGTTYIVCKSADGNVTKKCKVIVNAPIQVNPFTDVTEADWFYKAVCVNYLDGLMTGVNETTFAPFNMLTRAQFAVILYRMENSPEVAYSPVFSDVEEGQWYTGAVLWAQESGIVKGYGNTGKFGPHDNVTREQAAVMMQRYADYKGYNVNVTADLFAFKDGTDVSAYAVEAMQWAVGNAIITGTENGTKLNPQGQTLRAECAVIIHGFVEKYTK